MPPLTIPYLSGRIAVLADLHCDHYAWQKTDAFNAHNLNRSIDWDSLDALIIAGDLVDRWPLNWPLALKLLTQFMPAEKIYILPGNHDFYGQGLGDEPEMRAMVESSGMHFLQMQDLRHGATRLLACTLWTDFNLCGMRSRAMAAAAAFMLDYREISKAESEQELPKIDKISMRSWSREAIVPADTLELHRRHKVWLEAELSSQHFAGADGQTVVITHHGPHRVTAGPITAFTPAFHSDLDQIICKYQPDVWLFGHSHWRFRGSVGRTDIRNISIGYPDERRPVGEHPLEEMCLIRSNPWEGDII
jgi:predicted phosphodiesterase